MVFLTQPVTHRHEKHLYYFTDSYWPVFFLFFFLLLLRTRISTATSLSLLRLLLCLSPLLSHYLASSVQSTILFHWCAPSWQSAPHFCLCCRPQERKKEKRKLQEEEGEKEEEEEEEEERETEDKLLSWEICFTHYTDATDLEQLHLSLPPRMMLHLRELACIFVARLASSTSTVKCECFHPLYRVCVQCAS